MEYNCYKKGFGFRENMARMNCSYTHSSQRISRFTLPFRHKKSIGFCFLYHRILKYPLIAWWSCKSFHVLYLIMHNTSSLNFFVIVVLAHVKKIVCQGFCRNLLKSNFELQKDKKKKIILEELSKSSVRFYKCIIPSREVVVFHLPKY